MQKMEKQETVPHSVDNRFFEHLSHKISKADLSKIVLSPNEICFKRSLTPRNSNVFFVLSLLPLTHPDSRNSNQDNSLGQRRQQLLSWCSRNMKDYMNS